MRMTILATAVLASPTQASDLCGDRNGDLFSLDGWSVQANESGFLPAHEITVTIANRSGRTVRMVDASVVFEDALGGHIASIAAPRDVSLEPGQKIADSSSYSGVDGLQRMSETLSQEDVFGGVCVDAILFEDGEKQFFPPKD